MKFKDFKKAVIAYAAANSMIKQKVIKRFTRFTKFKGGYTAEFKYAGKPFRLHYQNGRHVSWRLTYESGNYPYAKEGRTINECCDFLWEHKTLETIQKNWYI